MKRTAYLLLLYCVIGCQLYAQRITNVHFEPFGRAVRVHYTLSRLSYDSFATLNLFVSTNGGESFKGPLVNVQGDIGKVTSNGSKTVIWQAMDEMGQLKGDVVFELRGDVVKKQIPAEHMLMYNVSGSSGFGIMYGRVARWGAYVRGKTNFSGKDAPYTCDKSGTFNYASKDNYYVLDGEAKRSRLGITAGLLFRPAGWIYLYGGAGYGYRRLLWHANLMDYQSDRQVGDLWAVNEDSSAEGLEAELGGIFRYKRWAASLGVTTVGFSFVEVNGAIGLFF